MDFIKIKKEEFDAVYRAMQSSFVLDEIRDPGDALAVLENEAYSIYHIVEQGERIGFISLWDLGDFIFAEHFVIYEPFRNQGYGGRAIDAVTKRFGEVVLEAEPPETEIAARRLAFYHRHGFVSNDVAYLQPSYRHGGNDVPLVLMSYRRFLPQPQSVVAKIYNTVYQK